MPCNLSVTKLKIVKIVHTAGEQDSACERVSLAYLILGPTATFQIKCKKNKGS